MSGKTLLPACLGLGLVVIVACQGRCVRPRPSKSSNRPGVSGSTAPTFSAEAVPYCRERSGTPRPARVQLLVDASGSMNGFTASMPTLMAWVEHSISGLRGSSLELVSLETCQFNQREGVFGCRSAMALPDYKPSSDTNLDQAIRRARDVDLTFIITDGVAATGVGGGADCASGVDAACVARALRESVLPGDGKGDGSEEGFSGGGGTDPGIWVLPLVATFDGTFYTEEHISLHEFDPQKTMEEIQAQLEKETVVREPRQGNDGALHFYYRGPKALLLIVIARDHELGRDAVWSFWNQAPLREVKLLARLRDYSTGVGSLPAIEVYPGFLNRLRFTSLDPTDEPKEHSGTLDATFQLGEGRSRLRLDCPPNGSGEGVFLLQGEQRDRPQSGTCVSIQQLPAYSLRLEASREKADKADLDTIIRGYHRHEGTKEVLRLDLACGAGGPRRSCGSNPVSVQWNAWRDYGRTAEGIAAGESGAAALSSILATSTTKPSREPHRVFGLAATLQSFYELVEQDARRLTLAELEVCNGGAQ